MTEELIGGHAATFGGEAPGLNVYRTERGILKRAYTPENRKGLANEWRMLKILRGTGFAPEPLMMDDNEMLQEDLGDGEPIQDGELFRRECCRLLWTLRTHGIRHGDLTGSNIIVRGDRPTAIDFQESNLYADGPSQKRPQSDSYHLWRWAAQQSALLHPTPDTPRVIRRWGAVLEALGGFEPNLPLHGQRLLDLGCFQGDFTAMAAAEGVYATGVDQGGFRPGEDSIATARELWSSSAIRTPFYCWFTKKNIMEWPGFQHDVVLLFSTWPYILQNFGAAAARQLLERIITQSGVFFFETQLAGDGPGPSFLREDEDVAAMLRQCGGEPEPLVTLPVTGREARRTVWKVTAA